MNNTPPIPLSHDLAALIDDFKPKSPQYLLDNQKNDLLLVLGGYKLACEWMFSSSRATTPEEVQLTSGAAIAEVTELFDQLPLVYDIRPGAVMAVAGGKKPYGERRMILFARTQDNLEKMRQVWSDHTSYPTNGVLHGQMSGFPATAVKAFSQKDQIMRQFELPTSYWHTPEFAYARFGLSRKHWQDELQQAGKWAAYVRETCPKTYQAIIDQYEEIVTRHEQEKTRE